MIMNRIGEVSQEVEDERGDCIPSFTVEQISSSTEFKEDEDIGAMINILLIVNHISCLKDNESIVSSCFNLQGLSWNVILKNSSDAFGNVLSVYLDCRSDQMPRFSCHAKVKIQAECHNSDCCDVISYIKSCFSGAKRWGHKNFISWQELLSPERGLVDSDDSLLLRVEVFAQAPHGVNWDSLKHTGYVGLRNQGATCYMNSLLQTLFFTNKLRRAVYLMPTEADDVQRSVPLALQKVFYELESRDKPVDTKMLTRSFGWRTVDSFVQHDVQELSRVLLDNMEDKMKGTAVEGTIPKLFEGKMLSYVKCKHVDFRSERVENYYDIQLNVKGKKDIHESFTEYINVETLDADNRYDAGDYGLQDAEKGVKFLTFPPVLHLQLLRFQYNPYSDSNYKINTRYEFPVKLDLTEYLAKPDEESSSPRYLLHAVLVHSGDNHGGHYVVYINPSLDGRWARFDDDVVSRVSRREAVDQNFGSDGLDWTVEHSTNAYMLVYVSESELQEVLCPVSISDIPDHNLERLDFIIQLEQLRLKERQEAHLYMEIHLVLEEDLEGWHGLYLCDRDHLPTRTLMVKKSATVSEVNKHIAKQLGRAPDHCRLWIMENRNCCSFNMEYINCESDSAFCTVFIDEKISPYIWVQTLPLDSGLNSLPPFDEKNNILIFLKYYSVRNCVSSYCGYLQLSMNEHLSSIAQECRKRADLSENSSLLFWEERPQCCVMCKIENADQPLAKCVGRLSSCYWHDGIIIVFQEDAYKDSPFPNAPDYFRDLSLREEVHFINKENFSEQFTMQLSQRTVYNDLARFVGEILDISPDMMQFFRSCSVFGNCKIGLPVESTFDGDISHLFMQQYRKLFYTCLPVKIQEIETMCAYDCVWVNEKFEEKAILLYVRKDGYVCDLLEEAHRQLTKLQRISSPRKLRLLKTANHKIMRQYSEDIPLNQLKVNGIDGKLRIDEYPSDEFHLGADELVVCFAHFSRHSWTTFGVPFTLKLKQGELFSSVRERVQKRLAVSEEEFRTWRIAVVKVSFFRLMVDLSYVDEEDHTVRLDDFHGTGDVNEAASAISYQRAWIGLDHANVDLKRTRWSLQEKSIKIYN